MRGIVWLIVLILLIAAVGGMVVLGAFPPEPRSETVQKVLPNERFQPQ